MKLAPVFVLLVALVAGAALARAAPPRSQILFAGKGKDRPRPGDHVVVYRSEIAEPDRRLALTAYFPIATQVHPGTPEGDVLAQMVVGEKRRYWRPPGRPGGAETAIDIELIAIAGAHAPAEPLPMPPPRDARRLPNGFAYLQVRAGKGTEPPALTDRVFYSIGYANPGSHDLLRPLQGGGTTILGDIPIPALIEALRTMVAGEERYFWLPPGKNAGKPMVVQLTLFSIDKREQVAPPAALAAPPKKARRTKSGVPYVILRRGRAEPARMPQDLVTYRFTAWRRDGVTVASGIARDQPIEYEPKPLQEVLAAMGTSEKRRLWLASTPPEYDNTSRNATTPVVVDVELLSFQRQIEELPDGLRVTWLRGRMSVSRGDVSAPLPFDAGRGAKVNDRWNPGKLEAIKLSADRASVEVSFLDDCDDDTFVLSYPVAVLKARLENAAALRLHRAGKHAGAEEGFRSAVALDPGFDLAYTNLASALALQGKTGEAVAALGPLLARNPAFVYFKVLEDPELASLAEAPELTRLRAPVRGTGRVDQLEVPAMWSEKHQLIATVWSQGSWGDSRYEAELWLFAPDETLRARVPLVRWDETLDDCYDESCQDGVIPDRRPAVAARKAQADRLLADLGFSPVPGALGTRIEQEGRPVRVTFPGARLALVHAEGQRRDVVRVVRGNDVLVEAGSFGDPRWAMLLPGMIVYGWGRAGREGCEGTDPSGVAVIRDPRLP